MTASIMIALPLNRGIDFPTVNTIVGCILAAKAAGIPVSLAAVQGGSCDSARSELVGQFLDSKATHFLFLDSDVSFAPQVLLDLLAADRDVVSAPYRKKLPPHDYVFVPLADSPKDGATIDCSGIGLGAALIKRHVLEAISSRNPELQYTSPAGAKRSAMFQPICVPHGYFSEDLSWCGRARDAGFKIEVLRSARTVHAGIACSLLEDARHETKTEA